jgi:SAM-dependent methyltransferase
MDEAGSNKGAAEGDLPFWERLETVAWFAARPPDERVVATFSVSPPRTRVLDLGCAAGRNADWLARAGLDVHAIDASEAMVRHTRTRLEPIVGRRDAARRVRRGDMVDLGDHADASFDAVIAIGLLPGARSESAWHRAVAEIARVLAPEGQLLLTHFTPNDASGDRPLERMPGQSHVYRHVFDDRPAVLLTRDELDQLMAGHGLVPATPTRLAQATTMTGHRPVLNGRFRKRAPDGVHRHREELP